MRIICPTSETRMTPQEIKKSQQNKEIMAALLVVGSFFIALGSVLIFLSTSSSIYETGYGFLYDFGGRHLLGIGFVIALGSFLYGVFEKCKVN